MYKRSIFISLSSWYWIGSVILVVQCMSVVSCVASTALVVNPMNFTVLENNTARSAHFAIFLDHELISYRYSSFFVVVVWDDYCNRLGTGFTAPNRGDIMSTSIPLLRVFVGNWRGFFKDLRLSNTTTLLGILID